MKHHLDPALPIFAALLLAILATMLGADAPRPLNEIVIAASPPPEAKTEASAARVAFGSRHPKAGRFARTTGCLETRPDAAIGYPRFTAGFSKPNWSKSKPWCRRNG